MSEATIEYKNSPNESTAYAVSEGQKTKVQMVATPAGDLELAKNPNVDTGYIVIDGKKHKCALVAEVAGELKLPTSATDDTGYVIAQDGRQHKVKLVANITGGGGGATINNQDITVTENGTYTANEGYTGLGKVEVQVPNPSTGTLSIVENGSYNVTEYATAEVNVPTGGGATTKFGVSIDNLLGNVDENGVLQFPTEQFVFDGSGIKDFSYRTMYYKFYHNQSLISASFPDLETISQNFTCVSAFEGCLGLTNTGLQNLKTISGSGTCTGMYKECSALTSTGLDNLESITGDAACQAMFHNCAGLVRVDFPKLTVVSKTNAMGANSSNMMFRACTALTEMHFRADAQATIEGLSGYASKFGAANCTIYFDLIGTITVNGVAYSRNEQNSIRVDGNKTFVAWKDASNNIVYTNATAEPAVDTPVYSDAGTTQVGTVSGVA